MLTLSLWLHDLDPFLIEFPDSWPIDGLRWYGLSYLVGFFIGYLLIRRITQIGNSPLKPQQAGDMVVTLAVSIVIGGRIGYAAFYKPELFVTFTSQMPWWDLLAINKGGMSSHGGMIGGIIGTWWYTNRHQFSWPHLMDMVAFGGPLGLGFGRVANFMNGELYGRPAQADFPLAVQFPQEITTYGVESLDQLNPAVTAALHDPVTWHQSVDLLRQGTEQFQLSPENWRDIARFTEATELQVSAVQHVNWVLHHLVQLTQQTTPSAQAVRDALAKAVTPRHPSQLYEAFLEGLVVFIALAIVYYKPRKPGVVAGWFCIVYGSVRIIAEFFREPDEHLGYGLFNLTRGQWLSVALVTGGIALIAVMSRRKVQPLGGWGRTSAVKPEVNAETPG